ncbi:MAG TPA: zinc ribbon domain-containing protein [Verrucomicrobiae bacterium]|jgi:RNA polymerase subunit RPABC4/transcription elongation factor Spt4|nr:zinc ribbon domain-containing protein [Verrucomicrobiae bacterium]
MDTILAEIGSAIAGFFGSPVVQFVIYSILAYLVVLWLASAYWVFRDMQQRTENAILPYLAASLVIVFLPVFPLAVFVYKIIRPHEKIGEVYERNLAEEALLAEVESIKSCPTCARRVNDEWIICPTCRTRLNRVCPNCSRLVGLDWSLCAWCGKDFERPATAIASSAGRPAAISPLPVADETGRIGRSTPPLEVESERPAVSRAMPRTRTTSPRASSPRTAPDGVTDH